MTIGEQRHAAVVEAQLRRIADAMEGIFKAVHDMASETDARDKIEQIKDVLDESHEMWDSDALDDINHIVFGDEKQKQEGVGK